MKQYWLMKTEPSTFSIDDLERKDKEPWTGVRNYQARNYMRDQMRVGDDVLFYHSSCPIPGVYGLAKVTSSSYPDPTQFDRSNDYYDHKATQAKPIWYLIDVSFVRKFENPYALTDIRKNNNLCSMTILQPGSRLSITPITKAEFEEIVKH